MKNFLTPILILFFFSINSEKNLSGLWKSTDVDVVKYLNFDNNGLLTEIIENQTKSYRYKKNENFIQSKSDWKFKHSSKITKRQFSQLVFDYKRLYMEWNSIFEKYNIKIWISWNIFDNRHMVIKDIINNRNGVSVIWQLAFNGFPFQDSQAITDIFLCFSKFSATTQISQRSLSKYYFITGITKIFFRRA